jgi:hypothetical protein
MKSSPCIPPLLLERYFLGELDSEAMKQIDQLRENDAAVQGQIDALAASNEEILRIYPSGLMKVKIEEKRYAEQRNRIPRFFINFRIPLLSSAGAACIALFFLFLAPVLKPPVETETAIPSDTTRIKGDAQKIVPALSLYRQKKTAETSATRGEIIADNAVAREGDLIQVRYFAAQKKFGIIFSIDGRGSVTLHYPQSESGSPALEPNQEVFLRESFKLDDAPLFERFFFITCDTTFSVSEILKKAALLAQNSSKSRTDLLPLGEEYKQTTTLLIKESR